MATDRPGRTRRQLLATAPALASAGLAGCAGLLGGGDGGADGGDATPTARPDTATPALPNVERRVVERDKAAITHIFSLVTGTAEWPEIEVVAVVTEELFGTWETDTETLRLYPDATFDVADDSGSSTGSYAVEGDRITFDFESGESLTVRWERLAGDPPQLELYQDGELIARYNQVSSPSDVEFLDVLQGLELRPLAGGRTQRQELQAGGAGSGFAVTPDGAIVTNAHVVLADRNPRRLLFNRLASILRGRIQQEIAQDEDVDERDKEQAGEILFDKLVGYVVERGSLGGVDVSFNVLRGRAGPETDIVVESQEAAVLRQGSVVVEVDGEPSWGDDVAILSIDASDMQTVDLGDPASVATGDDLFVIGYPDLGITELFEDRNTALEPTLTAGVVSQRRTLNSGVETIQTDADINKGNSGGPMYNSDGEVVGIATFGPADYGIQGIRFGLPVDVATAMLAAEGIEPSSGALDTAFDEGIEAYWRGNCETAVDRMETVLDINPEHPYAGQYIDDCESGEAPGQ